MVPRKAFENLDFERTRWDPPLNGFEKWIPVATSGGSQDQESGTTLKVTGPPTLHCAMGEKIRTELVETVRCLRNLLPYLKDWEAWQREIRRLERNEIKLRKHGFVKLAKTLDESLSRFKSVLQEERKIHAFTVNQLVAKLDGGKKRDRGN